MFYISFIISFLAIIFALFLIQRIEKAPAGSGKMIEIAKYIQEGTMAYLKRQFKTISLVAIILFFLLWIVFDFKTALGFLIGAFFSVMVEIGGMRVLDKTNLKVAQANEKELNQSFLLASQGGLATGILMGGFGLLSISLFYLFTQDLKGIIGMAFGASLISIFARLGGEIYTNATNLVANLIGKIEKDISQLRNPIIIAKNVGNNIGDCAGMAADLFETYLISIISVMILGTLIFPENPKMVFLPLCLAGIAILASIIATYFVRLKRENLKGKSSASSRAGILAALYKGLIVSGILAAIGFFPIIKNFTEPLGLSPIRVYFTTLIGLLIIAGMFAITEYFVSKKYPIVKSNVQTSINGIEANKGWTVGMKSTVLLVILISIGFLLSFKLGGLYGLSLAVLALLSLVNIIIALDVYGLISDNPAQIFKMADLQKENRQLTDAFNRVDNSIKIMTKSYAITSAGLAGLVLFFLYGQKLLDLGAKVQFSLETHNVLIGLFIGGILSFYFGSLTMSAAGNAGLKSAEKVIRSFKETKGLIEGEQKPDDDLRECVDIISKAVLKEMIFPLLLPMILPILVGFIFGSETLAGLLIGSIIAGIFLTSSMVFGKASREIAKIKEENLGEKNSFAPEVVGNDFMGSFVKDYSGLAINSMIKLVNVISLLIVSFLV